MKLGIQAGQKFGVRKTDTNTNCGIRESHASGWVCLVKDELVSFFLQRGSGLGYIEAKMPIAQFVTNFELYSAVNTGYVKTKHYPKNYPQDFLK